MKRHLPLILIGLGVLLLISGFAYDLMFAGIPYQDPTPEMSARYAFHSRIASALYRLGGGGVLVGAVTGVFRVVARRFSSPQAT
jgi:hypothetical protein